MGIVLITGSSRGIGAATAIAAAQAGHDTALTYLSRSEEAEAVADACREAGQRAIAIQCDVGDEGSVTGAFEQVDRDLGALTGLVNNAGILETQMRVDQMDSARLNRVLSVNVTGSFACAKQAVLRMSTKHGGAGGSIVNVSSAASRLGSPNEYVDYAASKGAIDTMTVGLAQEVGPEGIRVNAIRPGIIDTDIHAAGGEPARIHRVAPTLPLRRSGTAGEVAALAVWLLSDEAGYVSGALIDISGGR